MITRQSLKLAIESAAARAERLDMPEYRREPDGHVRYARMAVGVLATDDLTMAHVQTSAALLLIALSCCMMDFDSRNTAGWRPGGVTKETLFGLTPLSNADRARVCKQRRKAIETVPDDTPLNGKTFTRIERAAREAQR